MSSSSDSVATLGGVEVAPAANLVYVRATIHLSGGIYPGWEDWVDTSQDPQWFSWAFESGAFVVIPIEEEAAGPTTEEEETDDEDSSA